MIKVREASFSDIKQIVEINIADVREWYHFDIMAREKLGKACYDELTSFERYMHGGPWLDPKTFEQYFKLMKNWGGYIFVAEENGKIVSEIDIVIEPDFPTKLKAQMQWLFVHPDHRGKGISSALMQHAFDFSRKMGCSFIETVPEDEVVESIYKHMGFEIIDYVHEFFVEEPINLETVNFEVRKSRDWGENPSKNMYVVLGGFNHPVYDWANLVEKQSLLEVLGLNKPVPSRIDICLGEKKIVGTDAEYQRMWANREALRDIGFMKASIGFCINSSLNLGYGSVIIQCRSLKTSFLRELNILERGKYPYMRKML